MMKMFLDDERWPPRKGWWQKVLSWIKIYPEWIIVRSYDEACLKVTELGCPSFISFDHDLGPGQSGLNFVKWLVTIDLEHPYFFIREDFQFQVHSANPVGRQNIEQYLNQYLEWRKIKP